MQAVVPASLEDFEEKVSLIQSFDQNYLINSIQFRERLNSEGLLKEDSCYLKLDRNLIEG